MGTRVIGCLGRRYAADIALAKRHFVGGQLGLFLQGVRRKSRHHRATAGKNAEHGTQGRATQNSGHHVLEVLLGRQQTRHRRCEHLAIAGMLGQIADDFTVAKDTHRNHNETNAVSQLQNVHGEARHTGIDIGSDHAQQQAQNNHGNRLEQGAGSQYDRAYQTQNHQREIFGRAELESELGQWGGKGRQNQGAHTPRKK